MITLRIEGLEALRAALRALPAELADEGGAIVTDTAADAEAAIVAEYTAHRVTGNLASHVRSVPLAAGPFGTAVQLRSTARHAHLFERGTEARHYVTKRGARHDTGRMWGRQPANPVFGRNLARHRARMYAALADLLERAGLAVTERTDG